MVGAGIIGGTHSAVLQQIQLALGDKVELVAIADPDEKHRQFFGSVYGYREQYRSAEELLTNADVNTIFVCTPTKFHAELVHVAAARGLHIFAEKPLAMDYAEAKGMVEAVDRAGVTTQIGLVLRFSSVFTVIRDLVRSPQAGHPMAVVFRDDQVFPIRGVHDTPWRKDRTLSAGGTLIEHGVHDLDILTWLFGPVARLRAWEQNRAGHPGIEDYVAVDLEFENGLHAQLINVWHNMVQRHSNRRIEIFCENAFVASEADMMGSITAQFGEGSEQVMADDEIMRRFLEHHPKAPEGLRGMYGIAYLVQDLSFIAALLEGRTADPSIHVGLEAQRLAAATYHSARTGADVDVRTFQA